MSSHGIGDRDRRDEVKGIWRSTVRTAERPAQTTELEQADRHFRAAAMLLERGYARDAVFEAQKAMRLCRPTAEQQALYAWALYMRSGAGPRVPPAVWEHLDCALQTDPHCEIALQYRDELLSRLPNQP